MTNCPICGAEVESLPKTGDSEGFDCRTHGKFKVAGTVLSTTNATRAKWEAALDRAKGNARSGEWPCITTSDF